ncbi:MAG: DNA/RNA non-specific endonuclease [Hymenobacteraceae bacterium]|nr:DNA/RNA non-specific endonuclease [Hymenobacteraceae bacterium]
MPFRLLLPALLSLTATAAGCDRVPPAAGVRPPIAGASAAPSPVAPRQVPAAVLETFDSGSKGGYAAAEEALPSGTWLLEETLIGAADQDQKTGRAALRMKPDGRAQMRFDVTGAVRVTVRAAAYGHDAAAPWQLQMSENQGRSWLTMGATQTAAPGALREVSFVVAPKGSARFAIKHAGADGRLNFDDFRIERNATGADAVVVADSPPAAEPAPLPAPAPPGTSAPSTTNRLGVNHLALGNPSRASPADPATGALPPDPANYFLQRPEYVLSYNRTTNTANWVSWHLSNRWKGDARRTPGFSPDPALPAGWYRVQSNDYSGSGFDRGHLCPSDDRDFSPAENAATFRLTNIIPQAPANNQGPWRELEEYARTLAARGSDLYLVAGPAGQGGAGTNGPATTIGRGANQIVVPKWTWKIVAVVPRGAATAALPVPTRVIAIQMPNDQAVEYHHWDEYRVSVQQLEKLTGYDFFRTLPKDVQRTLETKVDDGPTR